MRGSRRDTRCNDIRRFGLRRGRDRRSLAFDDARQLRNRERRFRLQRQQRRARTNMERRRGEQLRARRRGAHERGADRPRGRRIQTQHREQQAGAGQQHRQSEAAATRRRALRVERIDDALHARKQHAAAGAERRHRRAETAARLALNPFFEIGQRARVGEALAAADAEHEIVAALLALLAHVRADPVHRRVIEQQRFDDDLDEVGDVVEAAHVSELVRENQFDLRRRKSAEQARRQKNGRLEPADERRRRHLHGGQQTHRAQNAEALTQLDQAQLPIARQGRGGPHDPREMAPMQERAQRDRADAQQPHADTPGEKTFEAGRRCGSARDGIRRRRKGQGIRRRGDDRSRLGPQPCQRHQRAYEHREDADHAQTMPRRAA